MYSRLLIAASCFSAALLICQDTLKAQTPPAQSPAPAPAAGEPKKPAEAAAITLPGTDGEDHKPLAAGNKKGVVLFFVSPYCPTANNFMPEMNSIAEDFAGSFAFYFVHSDADQKPADILQHTELMKVKSTVLMDKEQTLVKHTGAKVTPEAVVIGPDGKTLYQGRVNDLYLGPTKRQRQATTKDLRDALDAIKEGKAVAGEVSEAVGCKITPAKPKAESSAAKQ